MASYRIEWKRSAVRELRTLPRDVLETIVATVAALAENPFPPGVRKLTGAEHTFRIREGAYRIIFTVSPPLHVIEIVTVGHRKDVYR